MATKEIATIKLSWYFWSFAMFEYLNISSEQLTILWILMVIDFILWIWKQWRINPREITSHKAWLWAMKKMTTMLVILAIWFAFRWIWFKDIMSYMQWMLSIIIMAEVYSIVQNAYTIRTGKIVKEYDVISLFLKSFWDLIQNMINKRLWWLNAEKIENNPQDYEKRETKDIR